MALTDYLSIFRVTKKAARKQTGALVDRWDTPTCSLQPFAISMETMGDGQWLKSHVTMSWDCYDKLLLIQTSRIEEQKCLLPHSGGQTSET